ncbi:MAG: hypothetical protein KC589_11200 [Nanoarchaeota archaeon]|nr:hypothetical protein [Nanoarchaeota archaeon]MCA9497489.1 hypothetical protein [Nanoarchaeota archaeon]
MSLLERIQIGVIAGTIGGGFGLLYSTINNYYDLPEPVEKPPIIQYIDASNNIIDSGKKLVHKYSNFQDGLLDEVNSDLEKSLLNFRKNLNKLQENQQVKKAYYLYERDWLNYESRKYEIKNINYDMVINTSAYGLLLGFGFGFLIYKTDKKQNEEGGEDGEGKSKENEVIDDGKE